MVIQQCLYMPWCFFHNDWNSENVFMSIIRRDKIAQRLHNIADLLNYPVSATMHISSEILTGCVFLRQMCGDASIHFLKLWYFLKTSRLRKTFVNLCSKLKFQLNTGMEQTLWKMSYHYKKLSKSNQSITSKTWAALKICIYSWLYSDIFFNVGWFQSTMNLEY